MMMGEKASPSHETPLKVYTLGQFNMFSGNNTVPLATSTGKPTKLFLYLLTHRKKMVSSEAIFETLWPEESCQNPNNVLKNHVYRLNKMLGLHNGPDEGPIISCKQGTYRLNQKGNLWIDADQFESLCQAAHRLRNDNMSEAIDKYYSALGLYNGDYLLPYSVEEWILPTLQYYRRLLTRSISDLLFLLSQSKRFDEVIEVCEDMILMELLEEDIHLLYLEALLECKKTASACSHYQYITSTLYQKMGIMPSEEMKQLYRSIKANNRESDHKLQNYRSIHVHRKSKNGALFCDLQTFKFLCKLEKLREERDKHPIHQGTITLHSTDQNHGPAPTIAESSDFLKQILLSSLRKGDIISCLGKGRFVILLVNQGFEDSETILSRIARLFISEYPDHLVNLQYKIQPLERCDNN